MKRTKAVLLAASVLSFMGANTFASETPEGPVTRIGIYLSHPVTGQAGLLVSTYPINASGVPSACLLGPVLCGNAEYLRVPAASPAFAYVESLAKTSLVTGRTVTLNGARGAAPICHDGIEVLTVAGIR